MSGLDISGWWWVRLAPLRPPTAAAQLFFLRFSKTCSVQVKHTVQHTTHFNMADSQPGRAVRKRQKTFGKAFQPHHRPSSNNAAGNQTRKKKKPPKAVNANDPSRKQKVYTIYKAWTRELRPLQDNGKKRLRDIRRNLQHPVTSKMPATVRSKLEREAQSILHDLAIYEAEERRRYVMANSKRPRFFGKLSDIGKVKLMCRADRTAKSSETCQKGRKGQRRRSDRRFTRGAV
jgi:rRNA-processing protein Efg1